MKKKMPGENGGGGGGIRFSRALLFSPIISLPPGNKDEEEEGCKNIAESLYPSSCKIGFLAVFWQLRVGFFVVFHCFFNIGFLASLFLVFIKPFFENHEKVRKKPSTDKETAKNDSKTNFCQKNTNFLLIC